MAVVSISRIQIRRGRKNQGSGLPQLASGELGWATDAQELWIGNGAVSEGSPFVGNTKLLSERDDLFAYAKTYSYKSTSSNYQTGASVNTPIQRTLQAVLDDKVSIRTFGANGDGTDQTASLQRALDQLYLNAASKGTELSRVVLVMEPGIYNITGTIYIPPFATIRGAGIDKTIIKCNSLTAPAFSTVNDSSTPGNPAAESTTTTLNQARNIEISGLTLEVVAGNALQLIDCKNSIFENVKLKGPWESNASVGVSTGVRLTALSTAVTCQHNQFNNCTIQGFSNAIKSDHDIMHNVWKDCEFDTCHQGFDLGSATSLGVSGQLTGPINNMISNCFFDNISQEAISIVTGNNNVSEQNRFFNVGNNMGNASQAFVPVIQFTAYRNQSTDDWFQRTEDLSYTAAYQTNRTYIPEIGGTAIASIGHTYRLPVTQYNEYTKLFRLAADADRAYQIDYIYKSNAANAQRTGTLDVVVNPGNNLISMSDTFDYVGDANNAQNLKFKAQTFDEDSNSSVDTLAIMVLNSTSNDNAYFTYTVKTKS